MLCQWMWIQRSTIKFMTINIRDPSKSFKKHARQHRRNRWCGLSCYDDENYISQLSARGVRLDFFVVCGRTARCVLLARHLELGWNVSLSRRENTEFGCFANNRNCWPLSVHDMARSLPRPLRSESSPTNVLLCLAIVYRDLRNCLCELLARRLATNWPLHSKKHDDDPLSDDRSNNFLNGSENFAQCHSHAIRCGHRSFHRLFRRSNDV